MSNYGFFDLLTDLDRLLILKPSQDVLKQFANIVGSSAVAKNYGFTHLTQPSWLLPLKRLGFLRAPSDLVPDENGNLRGNQNWPG